MAEIRTFVIREQDGSTITPWKDIKDLRGFEWIRGEPALAVAPGKEKPIIEAQCIDYQTVPIVIMGEQTKVSINGAEPKDEYEVAVFQSMADGKVFDVSKRLADKRKVKMYDIVNLHMLGCCTIMSISKKKVKVEKKKKK